MTKTFTCFNCNSQLANDQLRGVFVSPHLKGTQTYYYACIDCWKKARWKVKNQTLVQSFICDYCKNKVEDIQTRKKVKISMPNELGLIRGQEYSFCSNCKDKLDTWNPNDDRDWEKDPPKSWE